LWAKKEEIAHWINVNIQLVAIPKFHIFPEEKHTIIWPSLLGDINERLAPKFNLREFFLADLLEYSTDDGDLLKNGLVAWFRASAPPTIVNRVQDINSIVNKIDAVNKIMPPRTYWNKYLQKKSMLRMMHHLQHKDEGGNKRPDCGYRLLVQWKTIEMKQFATQMKDKLLL
jgi:hypothetical protein